VALDAGEQHWQQLTRSRPSFAQGQRWRSYSVQTEFFLDQEANIGGTGPRTSCLRELESEGQTLAAPTRFKTSSLGSPGANIGSELLLLGAVQTRESTLAETTRSRPSSHHRPCAKRKLHCLRLENHLAPLAESLVLPLKDSLSSPR